MRPPCPGRRPRAFRPHCCFLEKPSILRGHGVFGRWKGPPDALRLRGLRARSRAARAQQGRPARQPGAAGFRPAGFSHSQSRAGGQPRRRDRGRLGRPHRVGIGTGEPGERGAARDRRRRERAAAGQDHHAQGFPFRRRGARGRRRRARRGESGAGHRRLVPEHQLLPLQRRREHRGGDGGRGAGAGEGGALAQSPRARLAEPALGADAATAGRAFPAGALRRPRHRAERPRGRRRLARRLCARSRSDGGFARA